MPRRILLLLICLAGQLSAFSCSMYKITVQGKTMVGNNEDSWTSNPAIWFEPGTPNIYGAAYVGYSHKNHADGGINEAGLAFDAFTMHSKARLPEKDPAKEDFRYELLKTILQQCKTVEEAHDFLERFNLQTLNGSPLFNGAMLLFVDQSGKYLVVEADTMNFGNEDRFALANFSYADTKDLRQVTMERYRSGVHFFRDKISTDIAFCKALSDTMSVHRSKAGDGTLYTTIYDLKEGLIYAYFFHDYSREMRFNLKEELAKGPHTLHFAELFPDNPGYRKFLDYKTPQNTPLLFGLLAGAGCCFALCAFYFLGTYLKNRRRPAGFQWLRLALSLLLLALAVYMYVLLRNQPIFYFPAPYSEGHFSWRSAISWLPPLLAVLIIPSCWLNIRILRNRSWKPTAAWLFAFNNLLFLVLTGLFAYWGLLAVNIA